MGSVEHKQSHDHGDNHQGVDHQDYEICRFHIFIFFFLSLDFFFNQGSQTTLFLFVVEFPVVWAPVSQSTFFVSCTCCIRNCQKGISYIEYRYRYVKRLILKSECKGITKSPCPQGHRQMVGWFQTNSRIKRRFVGWYRRNVGYLSLFSVCL